MEKDMIKEAEYAYKEAAHLTFNTVIKEKLADLAFVKKQYEKAIKLY